MCCQHAAFFQLTCGHIRTTSRTHNIAAAMVEASARAPSPLAERFRWDNVIPKYQELCRRHAPNRELATVSIALV
jgi:hypothetical protein